GTAGRCARTWLQRAQSIPFAPRSMSLFFVRGQRRRLKSLKDGSRNEFRVLTERLWIELQNRKPSALERRGSRFIAHPPRVRHPFELTRMTVGLDHVEFEVLESHNHFFVQYRPNVAPLLLAVSILTLLVLFILVLGGARAIGGWHALFLPPGTM